MSNEEVWFKSCATSAGEFFIYSEQCKPEQAVSDVLPGQLMAGVPPWLMGRCKRSTYMAEDLVARPVTDKTGDFQLSSQHMACCIPNEAYDLDEVTTRECHNTTNYSCTHSSRANWYTGTWVPDAPRLRAAVGDEGEMNSSSKPYSNIMMWLAASTA